MSASLSTIRQDEESEDDFEIISRSRRTWKVVKGERVWPAHLEAALLKGLENYQPIDSRETRMLGRFPFRNRFISDYIFKTTGVYRTHKQVGSRLQQIKDTTSGKRLLKKIADTHRFGSGSSSIPSCAQYRFSQALSRDTSPSCTDSSGGSDSSTCPDSPLSSFEHYFNPLASSSTKHTPSRTLVYIDILPPRASTSSASTSPFLSPDGNGIFIPVSNSLKEPNVFRPTSHARPLRTINPTVSFVSKTSISATSSCSVYMDGVCVHTDSIPLSLAEAPSSETEPDLGSSLIYSAKLIPEYWETLCKCEDPTRYIISQEITHTQNQGAWPACMTPMTPIFSAVYQFRYPEVKLPIIPKTESADNDCIDSDEEDNPLAFLFSGPVIDMSAFHQGKHSRAFPDFLGVEATSPLLSDSYDFPNDTPRSFYVDHSTPSDGSGDDTALSSSPYFPTDLSNCLL